MDSGHQSELSPIKPDGDQSSFNTAVPNHTKNLMSESCDKGRVLNGAAKLQPNDTEQADLSNSSHDQDLKKMTQKLHTLTVTSEMLKSNALGGVDGDTLSSSSTGCISPLSSEGGVYPQELMENFALNLHRYVLLLLARR